jgi:cellulose synthase/poly-beta-1,6-N-acetylglucosamine synthase-like glycosyltransferase
LLAFFNIIGLAIASLLFCLTLPGTIELAFLTVSSWIPRKTRRKNDDLCSDKLAIIVPAHNEAENIGYTLKNLLRAQDPLQNTDIVLIADNCTDDTIKEVQKFQGIRIIERNNAKKIGKGHALSFAFDTLLNEDYDLFTVIDADSFVEKNFISSIRRSFADPIDALQLPYLVGNREASRKLRLLSLAFSAINFLRPKGRSGLGLSAGILGNGWAIRRETLKKVPYKALSIVEDLEYHLDLIQADCLVGFNEETKVTATMPMKEQGQATQRSRWEGGRFHMLSRTVPILLNKIFRGEFKLLEPLFDLLLMPLTYHVLLLSPLALLPYTFFQTYFLIAISVLALHVLRAWTLINGNWQDLIAILSIPLYIIWKIKLIPKILLGAINKQTWKRTEREVAIPDE